MSERCPECGNNAARLEQFRGEGFYKDSRMCPSCHAHMQQEVAIDRYSAAHGGRLPPEMIRQQQKTWHEKRGSYLRLDTDEDRAMTDPELQGMVANLRRKRR